MRRVVPLLDMADWHRTPAKFAADLRAACHRIGFFTLRHRLPDRVAADALDSARAFFALDDAHKAKLDYRHSSAFRGYMPLGVENTAGLTDLREQVEIAGESPPASADAWPPRERLRGRNQWPDDVMPELRPRIDSFTSHMLGLGRSLQQALCLSLGLPAGQLDPLFDPDPHWQLKLARYPPPTGATPPDALGVGPHTDSGFLTLLLQVRRPA